MRWAERKVETSVLRISFPPFVCEALSLWTVSCSAETRKLLSSKKHQTCMQLDRQWSTLTHYQWRWQHIGFLHLIEYPVARRCRCVRYQGRFGLRAVSTWECRIWWAHQPQVKSKPLVEQNARFVALLLHFDYTYVWWHHGSRGQSFERPVCWFKWLCSLSVTQTAHLTNG